MRITRVTTKTGDKGQTNLAGGQVVSKSNLRVRAFGEIDELNTCLGLVLADQILPATREILAPVQHQLFVVGGELAFAPEDAGKYPINQISEWDVELIEASVNLVNETLEPLKEFVLPGGFHSTVVCHLARTVCRRAERSIVALNAIEPVNPQIIRFVNRLSDLLFVLARSENVGHGIPEVTWERKQG